MLGSRADTGPGAGPCLAPAGLGACCPLGPRTPVSRHLAGQVCAVKPPLHAGAVVTTIWPHQLSACMVALSSQQVQAAAVTGLHTDGPISTQYLAQGTVAAWLAAPHTVHKVITGAGTRRATGAVLCPFHGTAVGHWAWLSLAGLPLGLRSLTKIPQALG